MASDDIKQAWKVPEPTLRRLPWYLAFVKLMKEVDALAVAMDVPFLVDIVATNLRILDTLSGIRY